MLLRSGLLMGLGLTAVTAAPVVVHLRNGDRITGDLVAQETNHVIVTTSWAGTVALPLDIVGGVKSASGTDLLLPAAPEPAPTRVADTPAPADKSPAPVTKTKPKAEKRLRTSVQFGANLNEGAKDQQLVFTRIKSTYSQPYPRNPKQYFRTIAEYSADYGETDNDKSANRMMGSLKSDFDLGHKSYVYGSGSGGYDEVRKIDLHYEIGPGLGYHALRTTVLGLDLEAGLNYQRQIRSAGLSPDSIYFRWAEEVTWKLSSRISLSEKFEYYLNSEDASQYRFRFDATASYRLLENLTLNLTVLDQFDTDPAPKVDQNELQVRSSVGITF